MKDNIDELSRGNPHKHLQYKFNTIDSSRNIVAIYTILSILKEMRATLGLEAMLEYIEEYQKTIGERNPNLKQSVCRAMSLVQIDRLYSIMVTKNEK